MADLQDQPGHSLNETGVDRTCVPPYPHPTNLGVGSSNLSGRANKWGFLTRRMRGQVGLGTRGGRKLGAATLSPREARWRRPLSRQSDSRAVARLFPPPTLSECRHRSASAIACADIDPDQHDFGSHMRFRFGARERAMPIRPYFRPYLEGDPETTSLMAIAFEIVRAAVRPAPRPDLTDEMIAETIIKLAKNGERSVNVLCEAALSPPNPLPPSPFTADQSAERDDNPTA
jgi:hypothetical protein